MKHALTFFAGLFVLAGTIDSRAAVVFSSGNVPDLTDAANFLYSGTNPFLTPPFWSHQFVDGVPPAPVTVSSVEFYGYSERFTGEHAEAANGLAKDTNNKGFEVPDVKDV